MYQNSNGTLCSGLHEEDVFLHIALRVLETGPDVAETDLKHLYVVAEDDPASTIHPSVGITGVCLYAWPRDFFQVGDVHVLQSFIPLSWLPSIFLMPNAAERHSYLS